jgi:N-formylglutamate amidohydrolase
MALKGEDKSAVLEIVLHPGYKPMLATLDAFVAEQENKLLRLLSDQDRNEILIQKAKAEGARVVQANFVRYLDSLKNKQKA